MSLTGTWAGNDGSITQITEIQTDTARLIRWFSSLQTGQFPFTNLFTGAYLPSSSTGQGVGYIVGTWDDSPNINNSNSGTLWLQVNAAENFMQRNDSSEAYGTLTWTKQ
ncbi:hypothetical protein IC620_09755 [Hazenella sp. IB182357]|uniref:Uncharacterized protein n=1 Tax=Polycladospora coralii TaxID=2771432 RepID=A0A926NA51_9BACL|nr:hypothetical protein [Polycladospora coralii]MBD1372638.1 hypothetical protein [Polycladospora coralii]MBS7531254.1 hypothetical protein [Polycladospora coralii]